MASTGSGAPKPKKVRTADLRSDFLRVAQTSVFIVKIQPPAEVAAYLRGREINYPQDGEGIELMCNQTSLPGHKLGTVDVENDYIGVSEKMAMRKNYDEAIEFTFNVNYKYDVVQFFEGWIDFIAGHRGDQSRYINRYANYRMSYPSSYRSDNVYITKFEKSVEYENELEKSEQETSYKLDYTFVGAFPLSILPTNVSYTKSDVLTYRVRMDYIRYVCERNVVQNAA